MPKLCVMDGVREHSEGWPVELWRDDNTGRLVIRAFNEAANNTTDVDLLDVADWLRFGPASAVDRINMGAGTSLSTIPASGRAGNDPESN